MELAGFGKLEVGVADVTELQLDDATDVLVLGRLEAARRDPLRLPVSFSDESL